MGVSVREARCRAIEGAAQGNLWGGLCGEGVSVLWTLDRAATALWSESSPFSVPALVEKGIVVCVRCGGGVLQDAIFRVNGEYTRFIYGQGTAACSVERQDYTAALW